VTALLQSWFVKLNVPRCPRVAQRRIRKKKFGVVAFLRLRVATQHRNLFDNVSSRKTSLLKGATFCSSLRRVIGSICSDPVAVRQSISDQVRTQCAWPLIAEGWTLGRGCPSRFDQAKRRSIRHKFCYVKLRLRIPRTT